MFKKNAARILNRIATLCVIFYVVLCPFDGNCININPWKLTPVEIVSKVEFPADCVDSDGVTRSHLENWTSSDGSCDLRVCYMGELETTRWQINYDCPAEIDFLDTPNCYYSSDSGEEFPYCCSYLVCDITSATTTTLAPCADRSPAFSCEFWKNFTNCTDSNDDLLHDMYNYTLENCALTCGYCT